MPVAGISSASLSHPTPPLSGSLGCRPRTSFDTISNLCISTFGSTVTVHPPCCHRPLGIGEPGAPTAGAIVRDACVLLIYGVWV